MDRVVTLAGSARAADATSSISGRIEGLLQRTIQLDDDFYDELEDILMQTMFDAPSDKNVRKVIVTADCVRNKTAPLLVNADGQQVSVVA